MGLVFPLLPLIEAQSVPSLMFSRLKLYAPEFLFLFFSTKVKWNGILLFKVEIKNHFQWINLEWKEN